jgi:hypothetical protein
MAISLGFRLLGSHRVCRFRLYETREASEGPLGGLGMFRSPLAIGQPLIRAVARSNEHFLSLVFGPKIVSWRYVWRATFVSLALSVASYAAGLLISHAPSVAALLVAPVIVISAVLDVATLALNRVLFRRLVTAPRMIMLGYCAVVPLVLLISLTLSVALSEAVTHTIVSGSFLYGEPWFSHFEMSRLLIYGFPAVYSSLLFVGGLLLAVAAYITRPISRAPLCSLIEWLAGLPRSAMPTMGGCIAIFLALFSALRDVAKAGK